MLCDGVRAPGLVRSFLFTGENEPVVSTLLDLSMELHPRPHLPQSSFTSLVVADPFHQRLAFALIGAGMCLQIFCRIL